MDREKKILMTELTHGKDLAEQLSNHLNPPSSSSPETRDYLIQKILSSYEKALSMLKYDDYASSSRKSSNNNKLDFIRIVESPCSFPNNTSPRSEVSDQDCKDVYKKRKTSPRWTEQVKICSGTGLEGTLDDGYCWRKYGQKDILGANFPRGYYRCTHRHAQGCLATKQVQRSDADPTIYEVTYRGRHTCSQNSHSAAALASASSTKEASSINDQKKKKKNHGGSNQPKKGNDEEKPKQANEVMINFGKTELKLMKTEESGDAGEGIFPSFSFPLETSTTSHENAGGDTLFFDGMMENTFMGGGFRPAFISPATSESNYFSMSPRQMNNFGLGGSHNVQTPESDLTAEMISTPTSVTNSPFGDFDFSLANEDLDTSFMFDNLDNYF